MALLLRRRGIERVRPLSGGFDAWREQGMPIECEEGAIHLPEAQPPPEPPAKELDDARVVEGGGGTVKLGDLWRDRPLVLVFLRHFGCVLCRDLVRELQTHAAELRTAGVELAAVGNGSPEAAARFHDLMKLDFPIYVDPHRQVYALLGFKRNLGGSANPAVLLAAARAWLRGERQGATQGDPWQLGGLLIVDRGGAVAYRYASRYAGDHPKMAEVVGRASALAQPEASR